MENYRKGKNVEEPLERERIPINNIPENFLWMQVNGGSKLNNLLGHALGVVADGTARSVVWTGSGAGAPRAISCAEVMKRNCKMLHQITRIAYRKCEEYWEPQIEGLERLVVNREVPIVHILLSMDDLNPAEPGYQSLSSKTPPFGQTSSGEKKNFNRPKKPRVAPEDVAAMGLQSDKYKGKKNFSNYRQKKNATSKT